MNAAFTAPRSHPSPPDLRRENAALKARVAVPTTENARLLDENREGSEQRKALEAALQAARAAGDRSRALQLQKA
jgi:hypothetical protein